MLDQRVLSGIRAFNGGEYFQAHELWEPVWREAAPAEKPYYQGLIQAAVAFYHWRRGNLVGAVRLAQRAIGHLRKFSAYYLGLDTSQLKDCLQQMLTANRFESGDFCAIREANTVDEPFGCPRLIIYAEIAGDDAGHKAPRE
ncbi:MAG: DUF309 domain-containing protein [Thermogutta sp.]